MKNRKKAILETIEHVMEMNIRGIRLNPQGIKFTRMPLMQQHAAIQQKNKQLAADLANIQDIESMGTGVHPILQAARSPVVKKAIEDKLAQGRRIEAKIGERIGDFYYDPTVNRLV